MSKVEAPGGASSADSVQPAIALNRPAQGSNGSIDASPARISKMLRALVALERDVRAWEDMRGSEGSDSGHHRAGRRYTMVNGKLKWVKAGDLIGDSLAQARKKRDDHVAEVRHLIDYALTTDAYKDVPCPSCRLPEDAVGFAKKVMDFEPPATACKRCKGRGAVRKKKTDKRSVNRFKRISYFKRALDDFLTCLKIRMGTDDAYPKLEEAHRNFLNKFSNENQTSLEADDAEQGVRQGLLDAAIRFDPTRKEGAMFSTVAYNWCHRNSRARHHGQKRAGVYAPSIEQLGTDEEGNGPIALVTSFSGALGTLNNATTKQSSRSKARDNRCKNCGDFLSWDAEDLCDACAKTDAAKKLKKGPSDGQLPGRSYPAIPDQSLVIDLREKMGELPDDQRELIEMELGGSTTTAIARQLGVSAAKVRVLRSAAYETLRSTMAGYVEALRD